MSGADWRQQEEYLNVIEFVQGQAHRIDGKMLPRNSSKSFVHGWFAQNLIEEIKRGLT